LSISPEFIRGGLLRKVQDLSYPSIKQCLVIWAADIPEKYLCTIQY